MDLIAVLTIIGIAMTNIGTTIALFLWSTNNSNEFRKEANAFQQQTLNMIGSIQQEMKDFHGRLCAIEERRK